MDINKLNFSNDTSLILEYAQQISKKTQNNNENVLFPYHLFNSLIYICKTNQKFSYIIQNIEKNAILLNDNYEDSINDYLNSILQKKKTKKDTSSNKSK